MRIVVESWEQVLRYREGRLVEVLGSGAHRRPRWRTLGCTSTCGPSW